MLQTNRNSFGLSPSNQVVGIATLAPGSAGHAVVPLTCDPAKATPGPPSPALQVALKTNQQGVLYFNDAVSLVALLEEGGSIDGARMCCTTTDSSMHGVLRALRTNAA
jgi:AP-1 complex subunit beta-1